MSTSTRTEPAPAEQRSVEPHTYVFRPGYLNLLAGDDPALRDTRTGEPMPTAISAAAGLERSTLSQNKRNSVGPSTVTQGSLVALLASRGLGKQEAHDQLFEHVPLRVAQVRAGREVAA